MPRKELRPVPAYLIRMRYGATPRWYARFYGNYDNMTGKIKRFSFQVKISPTLSRKRKALSKLISGTVGGLLDGYVPEHVQGEIFPSFEELLYHTDWFQVRRLRNYEAGVIYAR